MSGAILGLAGFARIGIIAVMCSCYARPARLALIGFDGYGVQIVRRLLALPHAASLLAVAAGDPDGDNARFCREHGIRIFSSVDELLEFAAGRVDAVINATPIHIHKLLSVRCLEAGFPVWVEKPPVATLEEMDELLAVSARTRLSVDVGFNAIYGAIVQQLKAELVAGVYGQVLLVRSLGAWIRGDNYYERSNWAGKIKIGDAWVNDGTINNPFAHLVCNNLYFAAPRHHALAELATVNARLWHGHDIESEDTSSLHLVTKEGVVLLSHLTLCPEEEIDPITVIDTTNAKLTLRDFHTLEIAWKDGRREVRESKRENRLDMLENLCERLHRNGPALCPLEMTRPFTELVDRAFQQVMQRNEGIIPFVPRDLLERYPHQNSMGTRIRGINAKLRRAHEQAQLLDFADAHMVGSLAPEQTLIL